MPIEKKSPKKVFWPHLVQAPIVLLGLGLLVATMNAWIDLASGLLLFSFLLACSVILTNISMKSYRCPDCASILHAPRGWWKRFAGQKILFYCEQCNVNWDFGLSGQED